MKKIVIIGGAGLIGKTFVKCCISEKNKLIVIDNCDSSLFTKLNLKIDKFISADINNLESLKNSIKLILNEWKEIDCVVNTAYPRNDNYGQSFFEVDPKDFDSNLSLHLGGYFRVMQEFSKIFLQQGFGNIINISSIQGVSSPKFDHYSNTEMVSPPEYTAAKSGLIALTKYLAKYLKGKNIRVNSISPGGVLTNQPLSFQEKYKDSCINKGMLDPEDLCGALLFLISDSSKYVNGQNIIVDDGWTL